MIAVLASAAYLVHTRRPTMLVTSELGKIRIYPAWLRAQGLVYLLSGTHGWSTAEEETARDLARSNHLVLGIDTTELLALQNKLPGCIYMPGVFEDFSRKWQHDNATGQYFPPALLGSDLGGTLVYEAQLSTWPTAFSAAIAINPSPTIWMHRPFCEHAAAASDYAGQTIKAEPPGLNAPLRVVVDSTASAAQRDFAHSIPLQGGLIEGNNTPRHHLYTRALDDIEKEARESGVADLPLAEVPAKSPCQHGFAVLYSGDGGWRDLDRSLADILASKGMSVVGVDVLRYYWKEKQPEVAARDLERILTHYEAHWHCDQVTLIGFSFGADILPFLVNRLSPLQRSHVSLMTLLSPERTTAFEVEVNGWLGGKPKVGVPIGPEMTKISGFVTQCFYGQDEATDSLCTEEGAGTLSIFAKSGGHHFDKNYAEVADQIIAAVPH